MRRDQPYHLIFSGPDPRPERGKPVQFLDVCAGRGGGLVPGKKDSFTGHPLFASTTRNIPVERYEQDAPMLFENYEYLPDSEGAWFHRGGLWRREEPSPHPRWRAPRHLG